MDKNSAAYRIFEEVTANVTKEWTPIHELAPKNHTALGEDASNELESLLGGVGIEVNRNFQTEVPIKGTDRTAKNYCWAAKLKG